MVAGLVEFRCLVTLQAHRVTGCSQFKTVGLMAITAGYASLIHLTLDKRAIDIDFTIDLAVRVIPALVQQHWLVMVQQRFSMYIVTGYRAA